MRRGRGRAVSFRRQRRGYCRYGNGVDPAAFAGIPGAKEKGWDALPCNDGHGYMAPPGSYAPNAFGLHDTHGNVFEWVEDCWNDGYTGAPDDGSAWMSGDCTHRVQRGGAWGYPPTYCASRCAAGRRRTIATSMRGCGWRESSD